MLSSPEPELSFDLDYDELGDTRKLKVDPWTGDVLPGQPNDPDRTCRMRVDPWTGEVLTNGRSDRHSIELPPPPPATVNERWRAPTELRVALPLVAFIAAIALVLGGALGSFATLITHAF